MMAGGQNVRVHVLCSLWVFLEVIALVDAIPIDNELSGEPAITCASDSISLSFNVKNPFHGNIYVKDHFNDTSCKVVGDSKQSLSLSLTLTGPCGVRRRRSVTPSSGLSVDVTVVVMFHPVVLTKVDRAFNVRCFYMQAEKVVSADLDVSMLTTSAISESVPMPTCHYHVLGDGPHGTPIKFAQIGQAVYHKWFCNTGDYRPQSENAYCMTVHSCTVDDGGGNTVLLLDDIGCAQDRYLLQNLDYTSDNVAGQESHVFKFADKAQVYFSCQIRITAKENDRCDRPQCPVPSRGKRSARQIRIIHSGSNEEEHLKINKTKPRLMADFDISARKLMVLDIEAERNNTDNALEPFPLEDSKPFCIEPVVIGIFAAVILCLIFTIFVVTYAWYRASVRKIRTIRI